MLPLFGWTLKIFMSLIYFAGNQTSPTTPDALPHNRALTNKWTVEHGYWNELTSRWLEDKTALSSRRQTYELVSDAYATPHCTPLCVLATYYVNGYVWDLWVLAAGCVAHKRNKGAPSMKPNQIWSAQMMEHRWQAVSASATTNSRCIAQRRNKK